MSDRMHWPQFRALVGASLRMNVRGRTGTARYGRLLSIVISYAFASLYLAWILGRHFFEPAYVAIAVTMTMYLAAYTVLSSYSIILLDSAERRVLSLFPIGRRTLFAARATNMGFFMLMISIPFAVPLAVMFVLRTGDAALGAAFLAILLFASAWTMGYTTMVYTALVTKFAASTQILSIIQSLLVFVLLFFYQSLPQFSMTSHWWDLLVSTRSAVFAPPVWFIGAYGSLTGKVFPANAGMLAWLTILTTALLIPLSRTKWMFLPDMSDEGTGTRESARRLPAFRSVLRLIPMSQQARAGAELFAQLLARDRTLRFQIVPILMMPVAVAIYGVLTGSLHSPFGGRILSVDAKMHIPVIVFLLFSTRHVDQTVIKAITPASTWLLGVMQPVTLGRYAAGVRHAIVLTILLPQLAALFVLFTVDMTLADAALQAVFLLVMVRFQSATLALFRPRVPFSEIDSQLATFQRFAQFFVILPYVIVIILGHSLVSANTTLFLLSLLSVEAATWLCASLAAGREFRLRAA